MFQHIARSYLSIAKIPLHIGPGLNSIQVKNPGIPIGLFGNRNLKDIDVKNNKLFIGLVKQIAKPTYQLKTTQHKYLGLHEFHYPTHVVWQPIKITLADAYIYDSTGQYIRADELVEVTPRHIRIRK
jgi:hypothetical protein